MTDLSLSNFDFSDVDSDEPREGNPNVGSEWATFGTSRLVGNGRVSNGKCGEYRGRYGCLNVTAHELPLMLHGEKWKGQVYHKPVFYSCHKPSCPRCYMSWASREADAIAGRLGEASKYYGLVEHVIASVPLERYGLGFDALRVLIVKALSRRGVVGGAMIFHGFRYNK